MLELDASGRCIAVSPRWVEVVGEPVRCEPGGVVWLDAIHPDDRPAVERAVAETIETGAVTRVEARTNLKTPPCDLGIQVARLDDTGGAVLWALDVTAERQARDYAIRTRSLSELARTSEVIESGEGFVRLLQNIGERARELTRARYAAISTFDDDGVLDRFIYTGISDDEARRLGSPPVGRGLLPDLREHESFTGFPPGHPAMAAFLGIPIRVGGRTIGSLYVTRLEGEPPFDDTDEFTASVFASQVALGMATALAQERRGRVTLLEERVRIAHDLHDGTIQSLYALGLDLDSARLTPGLPGDVSALLDSAVGRINGVIADIRQYIEMLEATTPSAAPDLARDLPHVIRQLVPPGVDTVLNITAPALQDLSARAMEDLLFITREALSNAVRHGHPTKIAVDLRQTDRETALTIQDNGDGFDPSTAQRGLGYTTMQTRAERLGAHLTLLGIPGMGATVRVAVPRRAHESADDTG
jgi:signal transduction histidine kinase